MEFEIVYDLISVPTTSNLYDYFEIIAKFALGVAGLVWLFRAGEPIYRRIIAAILLVLWGYTSLYILPEITDGGAKRDALIESYVEGDYEIVEGLVSEFSPMSWGGGDSVESFYVDGVRFEYSEFGITGGYRRTQPYGGQIRNDKYVVIWHVEGVIIHLEIAVPCCPLSLL